MGIGNSVNRNSPRNENRNSSEFSPKERYYGLENFGNTCYCNSVLQSLYFVRPLRSQLLKYYCSKEPPPKNALEDWSMADCLGELFQSLDARANGAGGGRGRKPLTGGHVGHLSPQRFVARLQQANPIFEGFIQQDAHEFLNFLLNDLADTLVAEEKTRREEAKKAAEAQARELRHKKRRRNDLSPPPQVDKEAKAAGANPAESGNGKEGSNDDCEEVDLTRASEGSEQDAGDQSGAEEENPSNKQPPIRTWVHELFEGLLTNETRCLCCESVTEREETFFDLSLEIAQHTSVIACLNKFSGTELLAQANKFHCDTCHTLQEAEKRMKLKRLPKVLILHLKRFKYVESLQRFVKLSCQVNFPFELKIPNTTKEAEEEADNRLYKLVAVVVHIGSGPNRGHYVSIIRSHGKWILFDDEIAEVVEEDIIYRCFGQQQVQDNQQSSETGYLLFYDSKEDSTNDS